MPIFGHIMSTAHIWYLQCKKTTMVRTVRTIPRTESMMRMTAAGWLNFRNVGGISSHSVFPLIVLRITHLF